MVGDYIIPNITLLDEARKPLGVWGQRHLNYLRNNKRVQFNIMLLKCTLWTQLAEIDEQALAMFSRLIEQVKLNEGITEQLKEDNQMEWVARINNIEAWAKEIANQKLIYTA